MATIQCLHHCEVVNNWPSLRNLYDYSLAELSAGIDQLAEYKKSHADQGCQLGIIGYKIGLSSNASSTAKLPWQLKPAPQNKLGSKSD